MVMRIFRESYPPSLDETALTHSAKSLLQGFYSKARISTGSQFPETQIILDALNDDNFQPIFEAVIFDAILDFFAVLESCKKEHLPSWRLNRRSLRRLIAFSSCGPTEYRNDVAATVFTFCDIAGQLVYQLIGNDASRKSLRHQNELPSTVQQINALINDRDILLETFTSPENLVPCYAFSEQQLHKLILAAFQYVNPTVLSRPGSCDCAAFPPTLLAALRSPHASRHPRLVQSAIDIAAGRRNLLVTISGAPGCGKSTLAFSLAVRLGLNTVVSTDNIRHLMRGECKSPRTAKLIGASTYEAQADERWKGGREQAGYRQQCELLLPSIERQVNLLLEGGHSVILEGVHVTNLLLDKFREKWKSSKLTIVACVLTITDEQRHTERLASRAKGFHPTPQTNKYINHFAQIRATQAYLLRGTVPAAEAVERSFAGDWRCPNEVGEVSGCPPPLPADVRVSAVAIENNNRDIALRSLHFLCVAGLAGALESE